MTRYLTPEQVLFLHNRIIEETGGAHGVRELSLLLSAIGRPQAVFAGNDLYPDIFTKAAALLDSLNRNHPFLDGNKRTAISAAIIFLEMNGYAFSAQNKSLARFMMKCARGEVVLDEIARWLATHSSQKG